MQFYTKERHTPIRIGCYFASAYEKGQLPYLPLRQGCYNQSMITKQKHYFVGFLIIILFIAGFSIWLIGNNDKPASKFEETSDKIPSSCNQAAPSYIGLSESQASDKAKKENRSYRVVSRDGEGLPVTQDYIPERLNFEVQKGVVTNLTCG